MARWKIPYLLSIVSALTFLNVLTSRRAIPKIDIVGLSFELEHPMRSASTLLAPNASFGACLMMKDDNDLLYEWISYHYLTLPLRYLVVGSDTGNAQDPHDVLKRWSHDIQYWVMNSTDFIGRHGPYQRKKKDDKDFFHHQLIYRQRAFITTCSEFLQEKGIHWIVMIDSDEFIVMNQFNHDDDENYHAMELGNITYKMRKLLTERRFSTVLDVIQTIERVIQPIQPCYIMPRLRFGALERVTCSDSAHVDGLAKENFNFAAMSTLRYKQHAGKNRFSANKFGKVMVDLSQISDASKVPKNVHRPFQQCPYPVVWFKDVVFSVNHYTASWERYSHRHDKRRNCENWIEMAYHDGGDSCYQRMHTWFPKFLEQVGHERAKYLLGVDVATMQTQTFEECPPKGFDFAKLQKKYGWNMSNLMT
jgi:hypothetical protein